MGRIDIIRRGDWPSAQDRKELLTHVNRLRRLFRSRQREGLGMIGVGDLEGVKGRVDRLIVQAFRNMTGRRTGNLPPKLLPQLEKARKGASSAVEDTFLRPRIKRPSRDSIYAETYL